MHALVAVEPNHAAFEFACESMRSRDVLGPQASAQPVLGAVGYLHGLRIIFESEHSDEWSEHFLLRNAIAMCLCAHHGGFHIKTLGQCRVLGRLPPRKYLSALLARGAY